MKLEGKINGISVYSTPVCPPDVMYLIDESKFDVPRRKDGKPDMRYSINKIMKLSSPHLLKD